MDATHQQNGKPLSLSQLQEQSQRLREQAQVNRLRYINQFYERETERQRVRESAEIPDWAGPFQDLLDQLRDASFYLSPMSTIQDRKYGMSFPVLVNLGQLGILRGQSRILLATNPYAKGFLRGLQSYVIGSGYTYTAEKCQGKDVSDGTVAAAQQVLDDFCKDNAWHKWEKELFWRSREDGEYFLRHFWDAAKGCTIVRAVEPEQVKPNPGQSSLQWMFGIKHYADEHGEDVMVPEAYWVEYLYDSAKGEEIAAPEIVHHKVNVRQSVKRGLPDFIWGCYDAFRVAEKLRRNMGEGAAFQAAIAGIREHESASLSQVNTFQQALLDPNLHSTDPISGRSVDAAKYNPGTILDVSKGLKWVDPPGAKNVAEHVEVLHAMLRGGCIPWNAPEWLATASGADMAAYTASLTAGSPFLRTIEDAQQEYGDCFCGTMRIALTNAAEHDRLPKNILDLVEVKAEAHSSEVHDKLEKAQADSIRVQGNWKSRQTVCAEEGGDWEDEATNMEEYTERFGAPGQGLDLPPEQLPD
jgi:hypothetical protein